MPFVPNHSPTAISSSPGNLFALSGTVFRTLLIILAVLLTGEISSSQFPDATEAGKPAASTPADPVFAQRTTEPFRWTYDDHPVAGPVFIGVVSPIVWGLLILLATLGSAILLTPDHEVDRAVRALFARRVNRRKQVETRRSIQME